MRAPLKKQIEIHASPQAVWAALTEAKELVRWFPTHAEATGGLGGKIRMGWGSSEYHGELEITGWEPNSKLALRAEMPDPAGGTVTLTQEFDLEATAEGNRTRLDLTHGGFPEDRAWDAWVDGTDRGWDFELRGLALYLERHAGTPRSVAWVRGSLRSGVAESWERLISSAGLLGAQGVLGSGEGEVARFGGLEAFAGDGVPEGRVAIHGAPRDLAVVLDSIGGAYLRIRFDESLGGGGPPEVNLWMSFFGATEERVRAYDARLEELRALVAEPHGDPG